MNSPPQSGPAARDESSCAVSPPAGAPVGVPPEEGLAPAARIPGQPLTAAELKVSAAYANDPPLRAALAEIEARESRPERLDSWFSILLIALAASGASLLASESLARTALPEYLQRALQLLATFLAVLLAIGLLRYWASRSDLRSALLERGIPLCGGCTQVLRGLARVAVHCPHCGAAFDERLHEIVRNQQEEWEP